MDNAIIFFSGYKQSWYKFTGTEKIWEEVYRRYSGSNFLIPPPFPWHTDVGAIGELIERNCHHHARIFVVAYSWGAGQAFSELAIDLRSRYFKIDAVLCDPIYRSRRLPTFIPDLFALVRKKKIFVPNNVKHISWLKQEIGPVYGHKFRLESKETFVEEPYISDCDHFEIDFDPLFRHMVLERLKVVH